MTGGVRMKVGGELSNSLQPVWLALGTGILLFLSFPGVVGLWPLAWIALVPLLLALKDTGTGTAARLGLLAGMVHYLSLLYWIIIGSWIIMSLYSLSTLFFPELLYYQ